MTVQPRSEPERLRRVDQFLQVGHRLPSRLTDRIRSRLDLGTVLHEVAGARHGAAAMFNAARRVQHFVTHGIAANERERLGRLPQGRGLLRLLQDSQRPLRLAALSHHPHSVGLSPKPPPMKPFFGAANRNSSGSLGNLYLSEKAKEQKSRPEDGQRVILIVKQSAMAVRHPTLSPSADRTV